MPQGALPVAVVNSAAVGNSWFVNEGVAATGNGSAARPYKTLAEAQVAAVANNNDVVYLMGTVHTTATINWAKNGVSLVGLAAPSDNDRARISASGVTVFSPLVNVTGQGCTFVNLGTFHGFNNASAQVCWNDAGGRNFYSNVQFLGMGNATAAAQAGSRSLTVAGSGENLFVGCTIGLDTVLRATNANASLELLTGTPRNTFRNCVFQALVSDAADVHVKVGPGGIDRYALFDNCTFMNGVDSTGTAMTAAFSVDAAAGGSVIVQGGISIGAGKISAAGPVYVNGAVPTAGTSSIGVHAS
jgi:hypothetical protein